MATQISVIGYPAGVTDLYAYYVEKSLTDYVADKVLFVEGTGADAGRYYAPVDEAKGTSIVAFRGAAQPSGWDQAVPTLSWELLIQKFKADAELGTADGGLVAEVNKIQRAATAVTPGAKVAKRLVDESDSTLQTVHEIIDGEVV